jgi:hypothetical protein
VVAQPLSVLNRLRVVVTSRYLLPGRSWLPGSGQGKEPGAVVVPAGGGLVPSPAGGPAQREGEPGAGDQPGGVVRGQAGEPGGLGDRQPDRGDAGRAGLPAAGRDGGVAERDLQVSVLTCSSPSVVSPS